MRKYHIHIYKVVEKREVDIKAKSESSAKIKALVLSDKDTKLVEPDCARIALSFEA